MKTARFEVLSPEEAGRIHAASMELLSTVGVRVEWKTTRDLFRQVGAGVDDEGQCVRIPERLMRWATDQAPEQSTLYGSSPEEASGSHFRLEIGGNQICFAGLGTPTHILDPESGERRPCTMAGVVRHTQLIDGCRRIQNLQMDVWPNDIPMTTIHTESIWAWARPGTVG